VPRGALSLDPAKKVISNSNFQGLSFATSSELRAFLHMRSPMRLRGQAIMNKPGILKTDDFLDCIDMDGPKGKTIFLHHHFLIQLLIIFLSACDFATFRNVVHFPRQFCRYCVCTQPLLGWFQFLFCAEVDGVRLCVFRKWRSQLRYCVYDVSCGEVMNY
jgi:hypothetical protein